MLEKLLRPANARRTLVLGGLLCLLAAWGGASFVAAGVAAPAERVQGTTAAANEETSDAAHPGTGAAADAAAVTVPGAPEPVAENPTPRRRLTSPRAPSGPSSSRLVTGLFITLALAAAGLYFGRRFVKRARLGPSGDKVLKIVDALPLGPKRQVYVLEAFGRRLIVGATQESITLISEFSDEEVAAAVGDAGSPAPTVASDGPATRSAFLRALEAQA